MSTTAATLARADRRALALVAAGCGGDDDDARARERKRDEKSTEA